MTFGWKGQTSSHVDAGLARKFVERFSAVGGHHVDTARIYSGGKCEVISTLSWFCSECARLRFLDYM